MKRVTLRRKIIVSCSNVERKVFKSVYSYLLLITQPIFCPIIHLKLMGTRQHRFVETVTYIFSGYHSSAGMDDLCSALGCDSAEFQLWALSLFFLVTVIKTGADSHIQNPFSFCSPQGN